jgi:hypothetical protein
VEVKEKHRKKEQHRKEEKPEAVIANVIKPAVVA